MKKLFTIDDFMVAIIAALGYGYGEWISRLSGWPDLACSAASFALGIVLEEIISRIVFSKAVQKKKETRIITYAAILLILLAAQYAAIRWMGVSMIDYVQEEFLFVVGLPVIGFFVNMIIRGYHIQKIRKVYGDGSEGYVFDAENREIEGTDRENRPIRGEYDTDCAVKTRTGIYVGEKEKDRISFWGIPFAKPPVGDLRWKAPEPLPSSEAVFEAKYFGASAIQVEHKGSIIKDHRQSEDCLTLNIGIEATKDGKPKPVIVLFHHSDFTCGGSVNPLLYGGRFVENHQDVVFVSFNYRLGIFGFIDFSEVPGGEAYPDTLNLGLLDQIAALKWIRENIAAFGGDPDRITVMGFASGATSIYLLAASEQARGLFRRAFVFNGSLWEVNDTPEKPKALAKALLQETQTATMEQLMELDTKTLKAAAQKLWRDMCAPTCDGTLIPYDVLRAYQEGKASGIEFIIGCSSRETQVWRSIIGNQNYEDMISMAMADVQKNLDGSGFEAVENYIKVQTEAMDEMEAKLDFVEQWDSMDNYHCTLMLSKGGNKVHIMLWDQKPLIENLGSGSIDVVAVLLGNSEALHMYGNVMDKDLSEILQDFLHKFISGNALQLYHNEIKGVDSIDWKAFPRALIVSDGKILCDKIEDRLTEIKELLDFIK